MPCDLRPDGPLSFEMADAGPGLGAGETSRPLYLERGGTSVFAFLHSPTGTPRDVAVLFVPPFGWDDMCSYRVRREWAVRLSGDGHPTLRIDLPGSGDSSGGPSDPAQLDAWTEAVAGAAGWLGGQGGVRRVAAIGIGLGGLVACRAALADAPIDELVLWSVPARGRRLVRELRTFSAFEMANRLDGDQAQEGPTPDDDGALATNGYLLSAESVEALEALDLAELKAGWSRAGRALILGRDGMKVDPALGAVLEQAGAHVTVADGPGFGAMMVETQDAQAPDRVIEKVATWLEEPSGTPGAEAAAPRSPVEDPMAHRRGAWTESRELVFEGSGVQLRETPVLFDGPHGRLFGILAEPIGERAGLTAVLLNAGPQRRTGPNRMWVEIARRWAAKGVPTLRLDADGIGDSDGDAAALERVTALYRPVYVEQARATLDALAERGLPPRFVMLGLCSGAYWSAHAALADDRVESVIMLNPMTLVFDEWRHAVRRTRHLRQQALMPSTWGRVLRGDVHFNKHFETGRTMLERAAKAPGRAGRRIAAPGLKEQPGEAGLLERIEGLFDTLRDRGQRSLLLFTSDEVLPQELAEHGMFGRLERWPNLELALIGTSVNTHTLTPLWLQREVHRRVDGMLDGELARLRST